MTLWFHSRARLSTIPHASTCQHWRCQPSALHAIRPVVLGAITTAPSDPNISDSDSLFKLDAVLAAPQAYPLFAPFQISLNGSLHAWQYLCTPAHVRDSSRVLGRGRQAFHPLIPSKPLLMAKFQQSAQRIYLVHTIWSTGGSAVGQAPHRVTRLVLMHSRCRHFQPMQ
ncbi:hypothetical protein EDB83DRAFT_2415646 [Lactarius deliciosus]|nr:hypothetical protein EDB83DRAFT_2415646 [Lactarius deliciosus]